MSLNINNTSRLLLKKFKSLFRGCLEIGINLKIDFHSRIRSVKLLKLKKSWWLLVIVSLGVIVPFAAPYLTFDPDNSRIRMTSTTIQFPLLVAHIIFACVALISGFFQFIDRIRMKNPKVHRYLGRIYVISVFISGVLALATIYYIENFSKATSFLVLSLIWLFTCWKGYRTAVRKDFASIANG